MVEKSQRRKPLLNDLSAAKIKEAIAIVAEAVANGKTGKEAQKILYDGEGLSLKIRCGSALWIYKFRDGASFRSMSLGSYHDGVGLTVARDKRDDLAVTRRKSRIPRRGLANLDKPTTDPAEEKTDEWKLKPMRFADVVDSFITLKSSEWKVKSREPENYRRLKTGTLGKMWAHQISKTNVATELQTRWGDALANADKMRGRIELVINHAIALDARDPDKANPALKDIIKQLIPKPPESTPRAAMKRDDVPTFYRELVADGSPAARALAFTILTVSRNTEARLADWQEIIGNAWIIPGGREERSMKEGQEHAVPLAPAALALLGKRQTSGLIFGDLANHALNEKLNAMREGVTVHGFRTSFTSWAKAAGYPKELRELAKAHAEGRTGTDKAYERYDREDQLKVLRPMLTAWADFLLTAQ